MKKSNKNIILNVIKSTFLVQFIPFLILIIYYYIFESVSFIIPILHFVLLIYVYVLLVSRNKNISIKYKISELKLNTLFIFFMYLFYVIFFFLYLYIDSLIPKYCSFMCMDFEMPIYIAFIWPLFQIIIPIFVLVINKIIKLFKDKKYIFAVLLILFLVLIFLGAISWLLMLFL